MGPMIRCQTLRTSTSDCRMSVPPSGLRCVCVYVCVCVCVCRVRTVAHARLCLARPVMRLGGGCSFDKAWPSVSVAPALAFRLVLVYVV